MQELRNFWSCMWSWVKKNKEMERKEERRRRRKEEREEEEEEASKNPLVLEHCLGKAR